MFEFFNYEFCSINNTIFLTSNRVAQKDKGAPTLYAYDINGGEIFTKAFERDNDNQTVFIKIRKEYRDMVKDYSKTHGYKMYGLIEELIKEKCTKRILYSNQK